MSEVREELIDALEQIEHADTAAGKDRARVIRMVDEETGGRKTTDLQETLNARGVTLSTERIRRARYIGRLLHALDPRGMDPRELDGIQNETILYLIQRIHEAHQRTHQDLLTLVRESKTPADAVRALRLLNNHAGDDTALKDTWRRAFDEVRMPDEVATSLEEAVKRYRRTNRLTHQQALAELAALLDHLPDTYLRVLPLLGELPKSTLEAPWRILQAARTGLGGIEPEETLTIVLDILQNFPADYWARLKAALDKKEAS